jgi:hypothetical protein
VPELAEFVGEEAVLLRRATMGAAAPGARPPAVMRGRAVWENGRAAI